MSSYTAYGEDVLFGANLLKRAGKFIKGAAVNSPIGQAVKFVAHPIKETKAAIKTIARFDPTAKTAKYSNVTKGVLVGSALAGATILTGGGAAVVAGGLFSAAGTGLSIGRKPVRKPVKRTSPAITAGVPSAGTVPSDSYMYTPPAPSYSDAAIPPPVYMPGMSQDAAAQAVVSGEQKKSNAILLIGLAAAAGLLLYTKANKKSSVVSTST